MSFSTAQSTSGAHEVRPQPLPLQLVCEQAAVSASGSVFLQTRGSGKVNVEGQAQPGHPHFCDAQALWSHGVVISQEISARRGSSIAVSRAARVHPHGSYAEALLNSAIGLQKMGCTDCKGVSSRCCIAI